MKDLRFDKFILLVNGLIPGSLLLWDWYHGQAGANPVNYAIRTTGLLSLIFLASSLLVTPLRKITGLTWLFHFRRTLGLFAFFYALGHLSIFFFFDRAMNLADTLSEMVKRPYLIVGSLGLLAMVPLAATSTNYMIKRLGPKRWRMLHRLAYVAAVAGVIHFYMLVKSDIRMPVAFGIVMGILLGYRVITAVVQYLKTPTPISDVISSDVSSGDARWTGQLRVQRITQETPNVRTYRLVPTAGGELPFMHLPGQYLSFSLPIGNRTVRRSYTIASSPTRRGYCEVTIKREGEGLVSRHMHDEIKEGDLLSVAAAAGQFTFTGANNATSIALLAAGVGITPLMSILRYLTDQNWGGDIHLVYANKTERDIIFREEIEDLRRRFPNLHLTVTLTRAEGTSWDGDVGRIEAKLLTRVIPDLPNIPLYMCGPAEMLKATRSILGELGVPNSNIHTESFGSRFTTATSPSDANTECTVTFNRSKKSGTIGSRRPILALAEELGVRVDSECRSGVCGRCKTRMVSGSVQMEAQDALDDADRRNGIILLCQARALQDVSLEA